MSANWCRATPHGVRLLVQVAPNAKKSEVAGVHDEALKIRLQAQPIEGQANDALIRYLAARLAVPKSAVTIAHGHTSRRKTIDVASATLGVEDVRCLLAL